MNPDTAVAVFGYSGDAHQVFMMLPYYMHHKCPVVVFSPTDRPIKRADTAQVKFRHGGEDGAGKGYVGQVSLDRQVIQMKKLLEEFPQKHFLFNDSDSVCLSPRLPDYLYKNADVVYSNEVSDMLHVRTDPEYPWPRLAFQPPYFLSRENVQAWIDAAETVKADPQTPFLDWAFMAWSVHAKLKHANFPDGQGISCPTRNYEPGQWHMENSVANHRAIFLHSVKDKNVLLRMAYARLKCKKKFKL
jgi:hypothetical protein